MKLCVVERWCSVFAEHQSSSQFNLSKYLSLGFFFLLRPGEYCISSTSSDSKPFLMQDTALFQGERKLDFITATDNELLSATFGTLEFTTQKNSVRGEVVGLAPSGDLLGALFI